MKSRLNSKILLQGVKRHTNGKGLKCNYYSVAAETEPRALYTPFFFLRRGLTKLPRLVLNSLQCGQDLNLPFSYLHLPRSGTPKPCHRDRLKMCHVLVWITMQKQSGNSFLLLTIILLSFGVNRLKGSSYLYLSLNNCLEVSRASKLSRFGRTLNLYQHNIRTN